MANGMTTSCREDRVENVKQRTAVLPEVDVYESDKDILIFADLPGVSKDHLQIHLENDQLMLEGQRTGSHDGSGLSSEFRAVDFRRTFAMPQGIDRDKVDAELKAGVLRLRLPKSDALRPRQIKVRSS